MESGDFDKSKLINYWIESSDDDFLNHDCNAQK